MAEHFAFMPVDGRKVAAIEAERDAYRAALEEIATRPTVERNPDGDDQAAWSMQLIARNALESRVSRGG